MTASCYRRALRRAARRMSSMQDGAPAPLGMNIAQVVLLRAIEQAESLSLTGLAERTELDRSTVCRNVEALVKSGLVALSTGNAQREATVGLTYKGRNALEHGAPLDAPLDAPLGAPAEQKAEMAPGENDSREFWQRAKALYRCPNE